LPCRGSPPERSPCGVGTCPPERWRKSRDNPRPHALPASLQQAEGGRAHPAKMKIGRSESLLVIACMMISRAFIPKSRSPPGVSVYCNILSLSMYQTGERQAVASAHTASSTKSTPPLAASMTFLVRSSVPPAGFVHECFRVREHVRVCEGVGDSVCMFAR